MAGKGKPFGTDNPGNRSGKPKGARNRTTQAIEAILDGEAKKLTRKAVEMALDGDGPAMRLCLDRLCPPRKDRIVQFELPTITTAADLPKATAALLQAVAEGELTPSEAADLGKAVDAHGRAIAVTELADRLAAVELNQRGARR